MRIFIFYLLLFSSLTVFSQSSDTLNKTDSHGRKQGVWKKNYPNGVVRYRGWFVDDKPVGEFRYFNEEGKLKTVIIHALDGEHSFTRMYDDLGGLQATGYFLGQKKDSLWTMFDASGHKIAEEQYKNGIPEGRWAAYFAADSVTAQIQMWKAGSRNGLYREFFQTGSVKFEMNYADDKAQGVVQGWLPEGILQFKGNYNNGKKDGEWLFYTIDGKLKKKEVYQNGAILTAETYIKDETEEAVPIDPVNDPANQPNPEGY
ncbi:MAG: hypothetical protein CVU06_01765 [Bacteroidetes bacterium HGW-Bacteroidetes-22]|nr:MAG: hypothetical protein CVU06_01765 [Bacteroidetes bacterium HGW-Bacteroidetes-22]